MNKMNGRKFLKNSLLGSSVLGIAPSLFNIVGNEAQVSPQKTGLPEVPLFTVGERCG
jgi:hypothetical protein